MNIFNRDTVPFLAIIIITGLVLAWFVYSIIRSNSNTQAPPENESQSSSSLPEQTDEQGEVTIKVTPLNIGQDSNVWEFEITLDTHSVELDSDLAKDAVLVANGNEYPPLSWTGDPTGGHHRKGVLTFSSISEAIVIQLKIKDVNAVTERTFEWNMR